MKTNIFVIASLAFALLSSKAQATQADETTITITGQAAGPTPFINKLSLNCSDPSNLTGIRFTITPRTGSVTRPLSAMYSKAYLAGRGYFDSQSGQITVPVFGLYGGYNNTVTLSYRFADDSSKTDATTIATGTFDDACEFNSATVRQARTTTTALSYDFILVTSSCGLHSPTVIDTDGKVRWVGSAGVQNSTATFFDNAFYQADGARVLRMELDGTVSVIGDYSSIGVVDLHHNIDRGRNGLIIDVNTPDYVESVNLEIDPHTGKVLRKWNHAAIISAAMTAGGDDPTGFVRKAQGRYDFDAPEDWFHNNSTTYRAADDSLIVSSRENFVYCLDYDTKAIKWIFGDTTKKWYQYVSLRKFALSAGDGGHTPVGQHALSIGKDKTLLMMDNGQPSAHHQPAGPRRYSAPRKYQFNLPAKTLQEVWSFPNGQNVFASFCSSVYEDAPKNYLVDYANANGYGRILGLLPTGDKVFEYAYPTSKCEDTYRSLPMHWESLSFAAPTKAQALDLATDE